MPDTYQDKYIMKRIAFILTFVSIALLAFSCKGKKEATASAPAVELSANMEDYYTVVSVSQENNAKEMGIDNLKQITGTVTVVLKRNDEESSFRPEHLQGAMVWCDAYIPEEDNWVTIFDGETNDIAAFRASVDGAPGSTVSVTVPCHFIPHQGDNEARCKVYYDYLLNKKCKITFLADVDRDVPSASESQPAEDRYREDDSGDETEDDYEDEYEYDF